MQVLWFLLILLKYVARKLSSDEPSNNVNSIKLNDVNEPKEKMKRDASKGSENSAHTINRKEKEMKEKRSRSFVSSEGIFFMRVPISA